MPDATDAALILIVEDNEKNMKLARDVLQFNGFRTLEAGTAEIGLTLAAGLGGPPPRIASAQAAPWAGRYPPEDVPTA